MRIKRRMKLIVMRIGWRFERNCEKKEVAECDGREQANCRCVLFLRWIRFDSIDSIQFESNKRTSWSRFFQTSFLESSGSIHPHLSYIWAHMAASSSFSGRTHTHSGRHRSSLHFLAASTLQLRLLQCQPNISSSSGHQRRWRNYCCRMVVLFLSSRVSVLCGWII